MDLDLISLDDNEIDPVPYNWTRSESNDDVITGKTPHWLFLPLVVVPLWILGGNFLVLTAVLRQRSLRTLSNWVIASLALTDFLLALLVVPLGVYQLVTYFISFLRRLICFLSLLRLRPEAIIYAFNCRLNLCSE